MTSVAQRVAVAADPATPVEVLERLCGDRSPAVRRAVALNPKTPERVLLRLAEERSEVLQRAILRNRATPESVLIALVRSPYSAIRFSVERHPNAKDATFSAIAQFGSRGARENLAARHDLPPDALDALLGGGMHPHVAAHTDDPHLLDQATRDRSADVRAGAARNPRLTEAQAVRLAGDDSFSVRWGLSGFNVAPLPEAALQSLAHDPHPDIRYNIAVRHSNPPHIDEILAQDPDPKITETITQKRGEARRYLP